VSLHVVKNYIFNDLFQYLRQPEMLLSCKYVCIQSTAYLFHEMCWLLAQINVFENGGFF